MNVQEVLKRHDVDSTVSADGSIVISPQAASDLAEYLELMYRELFKRGLCPNGSPLFAGEAYDGLV